MRPSLLIYYLFTKIKKISHCLENKLEQDSIFIQIIKKLLASVALIIKKITNIWFMFKKK